jgi:hypothetical protein
MPSCVELGETFIGAAKGDKRRVVIIRRRHSQNLDEPNEESMAALLFASGRRPLTVT